MHHFTSEIKIIGINPFVCVPDEVVLELLKISGKDKGPIPVRGTIHGVLYQQTLVKYSGDWKLYINTTMLKDSPKRIGETIKIFLEHDPSDRTIAPHPKLIRALDRNLQAKEKFKALTPSLQKEIVRYISFLKTDDSIDRNVRRAINFLLGKESFIGRAPLQ